MENDLVAAVVCTALAVVVLYVWLGVWEGTRHINNRRRWKNARHTAQQHYGYTTTTTTTTREQS